MCILLVVSVYDPPPRLVAFGQLALAGGLVGILD
jgi:hypothetical protein